MEGKIITRFYNHKQAFVSCFFPFRLFCLMRVSYDSAKCSALVPNIRPSPILYRVTNGLLRVADVIGPLWPAARLLPASLPGLC